MTLFRPRPARIATCLLAGALVMAPLSANAALTDEVPGDVFAAASYRVKNEDEAAKNAEKEAAAAAREEARAAEAAAREEARAAEAAAKEAARVAEAAAKEAARVAEAAAKEAARVTDAAAKEAARVAEAAAREEEKAAEAAAREVKAAEEDPVGAIAGPGGASPSLSPVGATPAEGEVVPIDEVLAPTHLSAAIELFNQQTQASTSVPEPMASPTGMVSGNLVQELAPVLPPLLTDVVAAPFVVIEALIDAMAASGQALVIPLLAGAVGFMAPDIRRKHLLAEALGKNPAPVPSNEPRIVFIGW